MLACVIVTIKGNGKNLYTDYLAANRMRCKMLADQQRVPKEPSKQTQSDTLACLEAECKESLCMVPPKQPSDDSTPLKLEGAEPLYIPQWKFY